MDFFSISAIDPKYWHHELSLLLTPLLTRESKILVVGSGEIWQKHIFPTKSSQIKLEELGDIKNLHLTFDLVINFDYPLLESFDKQVQFIKEFAHLSCKYVCLVTPNPACFWYWVHEQMKVAERRHLHPIFDPLDLIQEADLLLYKQVGLGDNLTIEIIENLNELSPDIKNIFIKSDFLTTQSRSQKSFLLATLAMVEDYQFKKPIPQHHEMLKWSQLARPQDDVSIAEEISSLKGQITELEYELSTLAQENERLSDGIEDIYESRAWKLIVSLRKIKSKVVPKNSTIENFGKIIEKTIHTIIFPFQKFIHAQRLRPFEVKLKRILSENQAAKGVIIFPPSIEWDIPLFQRPQHLAISFSKLGFLIFFCEPSTKKAKPGIQKLQSMLYLCSVPLEIFKIIDRPDIIIFSYNSKWVSYFNNPRIVYEYIDELNVFPGNINKLKESHKELLSRADIVVATAKRLYDEVVKTSSKPILIPNGVDYDHFHKVRGEVNKIPEDIQHLVSLGKPIIGYYGALARWFDYDLLEKLARRRQDLIFILIGPAYDESLSNSDILEVNNIYWLGPRDYQVLPYYLQCFHVAIIPFLLNSLTHSTSPLKLFEFFAGNIPVVITPMQESARIGGVLIANSVDEFSTKINEALELKNDQVFLERIDLIARQNTWDIRAKQILNTLHPDLTLI